MRTTRLTAAGAAAVLALGGTLAGAESSESADQTVTIEVTAAPRLIEVGEPDDDLSVALGATTVNDSTTSTLAYNAGEGEAKITAELKSVSTVDGETTEVSTWGAELNDLTLAVAASGMEGDEGNVGSTFTINKETKNTDDEATDVVDLVTGVAANEVVTGKTITYTLGGEAPGAAVEAKVEITFTITDND